MKNNRNDEREIFLKYLSELYLQNPDLPILKETIYVELVRFAFINGERAKINFDSLIGIQVGLNLKYKNDKRVNTFTSSDGNFWVIENRMGKSDIEYNTNIQNGIKLYIPIQIDNLCKVAEGLFNFMINEGIVMQCKISKEMRNDCFVCRVSTKDDVIKIREYLNRLNYKSNIRPNPFVYDNGNMCIAIDGSLSYNSTLSKIITQYLYTKKMTNTLHNVCSNDFVNFVSSQIDFLEGSQKKSFADLYQISSKEQYNDFLTIIKLLFQNLKNDLNEEKIFNCQKCDFVRIGRGKECYSEQDYSKVLYVVNTLATYYSIEYVHKVIMAFIKTGEYNIFTRKIGDFGGIRAIVENNFSSNDVKKILSDLGWESLISASKVTYDKYGEEQLFEAIKNLFANEGVNSFTNDYGVRSRLSLVIPSELLKEVMVSKLKLCGKNISTFSFYELILEEINNLEKNKIDSRK